MDESGKILIKLNGEIKINITDNQISSQDIFDSLDYSLNDRYKLEYNDQPQGILKEVIDLYEGIVKEINKICPDKINVQ